jgi:hypothetical protein
METYLSSLLEAEGYEVFHPQEHTIDVQIARYKAARSIVSLDASPLHLAAMVVEPECRVAILNRGPSENIKDYLRQFHHFAGIDPIRVDAVVDFWFPKSRRIVKRETHSLLDFSRICDDLRNAHFISSAARWPALSEDEISADVARLQENHAVPLQRHTIQ